MDANIIPEETMNQHPTDFAVSGMSDEALSDVVEFSRDEFLRDCARREIERRESDNCKTCGAPPSVHCPCAERAAHDVNNPHGDAR